MHRRFSHALVALALASVSIASAQTTLVDANGVAFGRVVGFNGSGPTWAWMDNGPALTILPFSMSDDLQGLDFQIPSGATVHFASNDCSGPAYILSQTPGAPPSALALVKLKVLLFVADLPATAVATSYSSFLSNRVCHTQSPPGNITGFKASAPPLPLRQYYTAPFSLR